MKRKQKNAFTLVELLAVIVILAIILVIAVPKVMSIIEDAKKGTLESTAKMIASSAEKQKVQNTVLGKTEEITCDSVAKINKGDYASCDIEFDDNTAKVTIEGDGKFDGLWVCGGTKTSAEARNESCPLQIQSIEVNHPLFLKEQVLTTDKFEVKATYSDGSIVKLLSGGLKPDDSQMVTITSPNWPENYPTNMTEEENYWEYTFEGADEIQIIFDETSRTSDFVFDYIVLYDEEGNKAYKLGGNDFSYKVYTIKGNYVKITMVSDSNTYTNYEKGFSANIKPLYNKESEYTVSPSIVPNTEGNFDITITVNGQNMSKKITTNVGPHEIKDYVASHKGFDTIQTNATYNGTTYDAGIRYVGEMDEVNNKVYYNCESTDSAGVSYGENNYDYASSCEIWRIIGVFNTKEDENDTNGTPRIKIINTNSTFKASWDSSVDTKNTGYGINQWGESKYVNTDITYVGADLMQLLNGYYIGKIGSECKYNKGRAQSGFSETCDTTDAPLSSVNMKPLTSTALSMIDEAMWDTYAVKSPDDDVLNVAWAPTAYLEEKGISEQYTGTSDSDTVTRTTSWTGLIGLMSVSDITYANGWLYSGYAPWGITPCASTPSSMWQSLALRARNAAGYNAFRVWPTTYLSSNIKVISGNGDTEPYVLAM